AAAAEEAQEAGGRIAIARDELIQLGLRVADALADQVVGDFALHGLTEHFFRRGDRGLGGGGAHLGDRLALGLRDLLLRHLGAARAALLGLALGLGRDPLGLGARAGDDLLRVLLGLPAFLLRLGEDRLRLVAQLTGFVELLRDAIAAIVERLDRRLVHAEL